jgi:shikimate dehydrogenase
MINHDVSGKTQICGIIGDPVGHTISPAMHNAAFRELGLDFIYVPFNVKRESLAEAIKGLRALNIRGMNVTVPHKVSAMSSLDDIDESARCIGAVNTIVNEDGFLKGCNTDGSGFLRALIAEKVKPEAKNIVIIGAGGASRAISFMMADKGANLTILNRRLQAAQEIADRLFGLFRKDVLALELNTRNLTEALEKAQILVNATSVGMLPDSGAVLVPASLLKPDLVVIDIIYNPLKTRLLAAAEKKGAKIIGGIEMLVQQGAAAFELWTGHSAPVQVMREAGLKALELYED